ncbi:MAG: hypothetical protein WA687_11575 [Solirubrobacterales bacterium]
MSMSAWTRRVLVGAGSIVLVLSLATWVLPIAFADDAVSSRTVEIRDGSTKTLERSFGWGAIHSDQVSLALSGAGVILILLGALPAGSVKRITSIVGEIEFDRASLVKVAGESAARADDQDVEKVFDAALANLEADARTWRRRSFAPSDVQIQQAVDQAAHRERGQG